MLSLRNLRVLCASAVSNARNRLTAETPSAPRRRQEFQILLVASLCLIVWQNAQTQSPLRRVTNTSEEGISINPSMSGDGRIVVFESTEDVAGAGGVESFRAIRANVSVDPPTFLQMGATRAPAPTVSQDGSHIAFASRDNPLGTNNDGNSEIFLYDGTELVQVTNTSPADPANRSAEGNFLPSISDDGRFIAFSSNRDLANQNADANSEIFIFDTVVSSFTQLTNRSGIVGFTDAKISGNGAHIVYIRDSGPMPSAKRDLLLQNRVGPLAVRMLAAETQALAMTYGRAISDDGLRVVWAAETITNSSQVFVYDGRNQLTRQITTLGVRSTDVPLHPTISGDGSRIAFATRRSVSGAGSNSDGGVDLYTFDVPSTTFSRVTDGPANATAEVVSSLNDDGSMIAFNFPRVLTGVANHDFANNSEIYVTETLSRPTFGPLTILNGASFGHEPSSTKAIAPDSLAVARGSALAFTTEQSQRLPDGTFPLNVAGTTVTVNGRRAQIYFVSPTQVNFVVPPETELGIAEVVVTNSDGFPSRGAVTTLRAAPGVFTFSGDGLGEGVTLNAETLQPGPFDPSNGNLRLIIFSTGIRNSLQVSITAGALTLTLESIRSSPNMPGFDEIHVLVPADLRGAGSVELVVRADARDSNPATVTFLGDARRDIVINEFLADPPDGIAGDANQDGVRIASDDEFVELVNATLHDIDVSGYQILTRGGSGTSDQVRHTFAPGTILTACSAIVVFGGGVVDSINPVFGDAQVVRASSGGLSLINSSGVITLRDQAAAIVNLMNYGGSTGIDGDANQSLTRSPDVIGNFMAHQSANSGRLFSPGIRVDGAQFAPCPPVMHVEVLPQSATINIGASQQFTARAFDALNNEVSGVIFSWQTGSTEVATIDQNGLATGVAQGRTEIRATGRGVQSAPVVLMVNQPPPVLTGATISPNSANIGVGETQTFFAQAKDQFGQNIGGVTITFASTDTTIAAIDSVNSTSGTGSASATLIGRANGSVEIRAFANNGTTTVMSDPATLTVEPGAGQLLISEFRTRGPTGASDEFIEIYNPTTSTLIIGGLKIRASNSAGTISDRVTVHAGTTLGPGCHYLLANGSSGSYSGAVPADQAYSTGITDDGGIAITDSNGTRIIDAVGLSVGSAYKEGNTLTPLAGTLGHSYERKPGGKFGNGTDTNNNTNDFTLTSLSDPQNSASNCLNTSSADLSINISDSPDPVIIGSTLTYTLTLVNNGVAAAESVILTDNLPADVSFVSCSATGEGICAGSGNSPTITFASLASGATAVITLVVRANGVDGTIITNTASVASNTTDPNLSNNSAIASTSVQAPPPELTINDVSLEEGDTGTTTFTFNVSLSSTAPTGGVTFDIATQDGTATAVSGDYISKSVTSQTIPAGQQTFIFDVDVDSDTLVEPSETFFVNITNVSGASVSDGLGQGTIQNDDNAILVISQLYAGGGNSGGQFTHDFVEIFNRSKATINFALTPYSIQYAGATANFGSNKLDVTSGVMEPGQYFLVRLSSGGVNGDSLPTHDASGNIAMAASSGKVALVAGTSSLSGSGCPLHASVSDFVGYGTTAACFEGSAHAPAPSNTTADFRKTGGCTDHNDNASDFFLSAPFPRTSSSPINTCRAVTPPNLTINDITVTEGNSGTTMATFTVSLSAPAPSTDITFDIATSDGTAQDDNPASEDNDYVTRSLTSQIIPAGQQTYSFTVTVNRDVAIEPNETFFVDVMNLSGAVLLDGQGVGTILNDDLPTLTIDDLTSTEGNFGTKIFAFTVSLSSPAPASVTFNIATADSTAQDGNPSGEDNDYLANSLALQSITAGQQTYAFEVRVNGDSSIEANETFFVNVTDVSGAVVADDQGLGTIQNDDSPTLTINDVTANEGSSGTTTFTFMVTSSLSAPAGGITFDIATADGTAQDASPSEEDNDYVAKSLTAQTIPAGQQTYLFDVTVNGDTLVEPNETFSVNITSISGATLSDGSAQGTIQNDDMPLLVISQVYGGGGNSGATYQNDFIEIFNSGTTTVDFSVTPYSLQYAASTSAFSINRTSLTSGVILPGGYFLIQQGSSGAIGGVLPTPDAIGSINLSATAGKLALVSGTSFLTAMTCPGDDGVSPFNPNVPTIVDFVGYGSAANCYEGTGPISVSGTNANARSIIRTASCTDTNNNSADFSNPATPPNARNSAITPAPCP